MLGVLLALTTVACTGDQGAEVDSDVSQDLAISSSALTEGGEVPTRFTCDGDEVSPPLSWSGGTAKRWALVVDDPDAPGGTFTHWVVVDIPVGTTSVAAGQVPTGGVELANSSGGTSYAGPCPPDGEHHYRFMVYALDAATGLAEDATLEEGLSAIGDHGISRGRLTAVYARS